MERNGGATFLCHLEEMAALRYHGLLLHTVAFVVLREALSPGIMFLSNFHRNGICKWPWKELVESGL